MMVYINVIGVEGCRWDLVAAMRYCRSVLYLTIRDFIWHAVARTVICMTVAPAAYVFCSQRGQAKSGSKVPSNGGFVVVSVCGIYFASIMLFADGLYWLQTMWPPSKQVAPTLFWCRKSIQLEGMWTEYSRILVAVERNDGRLRWMLRTGSVPVENSAHRW